MATLCEYSLSSSRVTASPCHSKRFGSALGLWGPRALFHCLSQYVGVDRQVKDTGAQLSPVLCECLCVSTHACTCIWPQPAEYPTACLFLLPAEGVWSGLGPVPSYVGWMVSTTHTIWCQRGSQLVPRPCFTTKLISGVKIGGNNILLKTKIFIYFLLVTSSQGFSYSLSTATSY